ncbi:hypothetical protein Ppa06_30230 [Planomonospora parontospora subsp. parontospora]|uniref:PepSY domain-containing protein n=3 Tax=Planomonospora parontospora TaxID=58119 RepID=A0AA37BHM6_9ACTN|nr:hypothetical protein GCM10010126_34320 [Planomonospora parontospora]GII09225.1 hypothetical protein Ppa06_30230 [Planomonospora parontospora subsp. parontospora]
MFVRIALATAGTAILLSSGGAASATRIESAPGAASARPTTVGTASLPAAGVSSRQAAQIARGKVPGARVTRVRRVWDQGIWNWRVELVKAPWRYDLFVSVRSGRVVRIKINYGY